MMNPWQTRDTRKWIFTLLTIVGIFALLGSMPSLLAPLGLSMACALLIAPWIIRMERLGLDRTKAIIFIFVTAFSTVLMIIASTYQKAIDQWNQIQQLGPKQVENFILHVSQFEKQMVQRFPLFSTLHLSTLSQSWYEGSSHWLNHNGAGLLSDALTWSVLVPFFTLFLLLEGKSLEKKFFSLIPNRNFEFIFSVIHDSIEAISNYLQAKLIEAAVIGGLITVSALIVKAPYAYVLGPLAGITSIIPYLGPILGFAPVIILIPHDQWNLIYQLSLIYLGVNLFDMMVIFPLLISQSINLHPFLLICILSLAEKNYGLIGMIICIPAACSIKVIFTEIYLHIYGTMRQKI